MNHVAWPGSVCGNCGHEPRRCDARNALAPGPEEIARLTADMRANHLAAKEDAPKGGDHDGHPRVCSIDDLVRLTSARWRG